MKKKTKLVLVSGVISIVLILIYIGTYSTCNNVFECTEVLYAAMLVLFPIIPLFIFSLITYKMREEVYQVWWKFARIWIPLSMLAVIISPSYGNWMIPIEKGTVAFALSVLFVIISLVLIIWQSVKERRKES